MSDLLILTLALLLYVVLLSAIADPLDSIRYDSTRHNWVFEPADISCSFQTGIDNNMALDLMFGNCIDVKFYPTTTNYGRDDTYYCVVSECPLDTNLPIGE